VEKHRAAVRGSRDPSLLFSMGWDGVKITEKDCRSQKEIAIKQIEEKI